MTVQSLAQEFRLLLPCGNSLKLCFSRGLPQWLGNKESSCNARDAGDMGSTPGSGRSPRGGNGNPLQYSRLENPMDRGAWWVPWTGESHGQRSPWGLKESDTTERLSMHVLLQSPQCQRSLHQHPGFPSGSDSGHFWAQSAGQDYPDATCHPSRPHLQGTELWKIQLFHVLRRGNEDRPLESAACCH